MHDWIQFVGPHGAVQLFGVKLVGVNGENGKKLLFTLIFLLLVIGLGRVLRWMARWTGSRSRATVRATFWTRQAVSIAVTLVSIIGMASIWFDDPSQLTTAVGLVTAGLAFALQRVVTAVAGYFVILRGKTFNVGDRITMGGVRGDVVGLTFLQTVIMEMGQPPSVQNADPAMWVQARQYSGRLVTVTNAKIFDEPVFNYTRGFPYIWEEMQIPIPFTGDRKKAEEIIREAAERHTVQIREMSEPELQELERRYFIKASDVGPTVYYRLTDNWIEMSVRFIVKDHGVREVKDRMSRDILAGFEQAGISIASGTYEVVGMPPLKIQMS
jgi:small-conductance mechanosensitive channel